MAVRSLWVRLCPYIERDTRIVLAAGAAALQMAERVALPGCLFAVLAAGQVPGLHGRDRRPDTGLPDGLETPGTRRVVPVL